MNSEPKLSVGVVSADLANFARDLQLLKEAAADYLHLDVMDGDFVPMILDAGLLMKAIKANSEIEIDVHLMSNRLEQNIARFAGANMITAHVEATKHLHRVVQQIKSLDAKVGLALNPGTSLTSLDEVLAELDLVLLLAINPAFPKQSFITATLDKIKRLRKIRKERNLDFKIAVDGGVNLDNAKIITAAGADIIVSGSAIFKNSEIKNNINAFRSEFKQGLKEKGV